MTAGTDSVDDDDSEESDETADKAEAELGVRVAEVGCGDDGSVLSCETELFIANRGRCGLVGNVEAGVEVANDVRS